MEVVLSCSIPCLAHMAGKSHKTTCAGAESPCVTKPCKCYCFDRWPLQLTTELCVNIKAFTVHSFEPHIEKSSTLAFSFHKVSEKCSSFNPNMQCGRIYTNIQLFIQTHFILHRLSH